MYIAKLLPPILPSYATDNSYKYKCVLHGGVRPTRWCNYRHGGVSGSALACGECKSC